MKPQISVNEKSIVSSAGIKSAFVEADFVFGCAVTVNRNGDIAIMTNTTDTEAIVSLLGAVIENLTGHDC